MSAPEEPPTPENNNTLVLRFSVDPLKAVSCLKMAHYSFRSSSNFTIFVAWIEVPATDSQLWLLMLAMIYQNKYQNQGCDSLSTVGRGVAGMGSMGSAEPINFQRWVLKPINFQRWVLEPIIFQEIQ